MAPLVEREREREREREHKQNGETVWREIQWKRMLDLSLCMGGILFKEA